MLGITGFRSLSSTSTHGDFGPQSLVDRPGYFRNGGHSVDRPQGPLFRVIVDKRRSLQPERSQAGPQHLRVVVRPDRLVACLHLGNPVIATLEEGALIELELTHARELEALGG